jgi:hypothetical protein
MSCKEVRDTVDARLAQRNDEIYALSGMIRVAVLSVFPSTGVRFPAPPGQDEKEEAWMNSKKYMKALQEKRRCKNDSR